MNEHYVTAMTADPNDPEDVCLACRCGEVFTGTRELLATTLYWEHRDAARRRSPDPADEESRIARCAQVLRNRVAKYGPQTRRQLKDAAGRYRDVFRDALAESGLIEGPGKLWRLP